ncbi:KAP family P-loop domain protein [Salmonella enterica subsp. enterica serovar Stanley]|uniref:KAP family P-loop NTPase fold protein n=1 Tax=Salmonella enterica TaxID=28901 RepID=UPI000F7AADD4|nr:P-loop NTPase fold protein [Salmonella enterica]ECL8743318.1 KAP family P-loop domain protein [Salmonella enterica subsp. enterica]EGJ3154355.1 KAP family P-loop domain protein [Salmonella enterica subsp. enterica serovar Newport]MBJ3223327.1 KAP family P-loop domain protein [Salmonella enterica subsp. enterica serovar Bovismorbificans]MBJ5897981.1 KAP family P-loop domain protein [Salmonella enterica subsp. enterica serovar Bredeney]EBP3167491.1 KAP family P-loop domain protein [Salmonella
MWSDKESSEDYLNFGEVSQLAVDVLTTNDMLPVSLGIFGNWGAGKSSLLKLIEQKLEQDDKDWIVINFDSWLYQGYDDARAALLEVIATELTKAAEGNSTLISKTKRLLSRVDGFRAMGLLAEGAALIAGLPTGGLLSRSIGALRNVTDGIQSQEEYEALGNLAKEGKETAGSLIKPEAKKSPPQQIDAFRKEYGEILEELGKPLIVVIDNLDRCLPANAIHTLEAIRLFLFLTNTAFIIAADEDMIRSSVADYFKGASQRHQIDYLDKLIQVPIRVPKAGVREIRSYLFMLYSIEHGLEGKKLTTLREGLEKALQQSWKDEPISRQDALKMTGEADDSNLALAFARADRIAPILANSPIIHGNPRIVKRLLNVVKMRSQIAKRRTMPLDEAIITKLVIFERCVGVDGTADLYHLVDIEQGVPQILKQLEDTDGQIPTDAPKTWTDNPTTKAFISQWAQLEPRLGGIDLRAAIYLSRETMPIGAYVVGLSPSGREALNALIELKNTSSPTAEDLLKTLPREEQVPVMEGLISQLRQTSDWARKPKGFSGACLLARHSADAASILIRYLQELQLEMKRPAWMTAALRDEQWNKDA